MKHELCKKCRRQNDCHLGEYEYMQDVLNMGCNGFLPQDGLYQKYLIQHTDGSPVDPDGQYFVLKMNSSDPAHREACRAALQTYAEKIKDVLPQLAKDLFVLLDDEESRKKRIHDEIEFYSNEPINPEN